MFEFSDGDFNPLEIVSPIVVHKLLCFLYLSGCNSGKTKALIRGFTDGFDIGYRGPKIRKNTSNNVPLTVGTDQDLWEKVMKEVKLKKYSGPFTGIPSEDS